MSTLNTRERIVKARFNMLMGTGGNKAVLGFFGQLAIRMKLVPIEENFPTMGTNGRELYYSPEFVDSLSDDELLFVVGHETLHCVYEHVAKWRRQDRDPGLWNQAADFVINGELCRLGVGKMPDPLHVNGEECKPCYDTKYDQTWTVEQVYDDLMHQYGQQGAPNMVVLDNHMEPGDGGDGDQDGVRGLSPSEASQVADDLKEAVKEAAKEHKIGKGAGSGNSYLERLCEELLEGKVDWRDVLKTQITNCFDRVDYTYRKWNRRNSLLNGAVLPSVFHEGDIVKIYVGIDVSGSISNNDVKVFLSELHEITEQFDDFEICIFCFADGVLRKTFRRFVSDSGEDVSEYQPSGTGGTSFGPIYRYLKDEGVVPEQLIVMTDGYSFDGWGDPEYCDTLWLLVNNDGSYERPTHGIAVYYDTEQVVKG